MGETTATAVPTATAAPPEPDGLLRVMVIGAIVVSAISTIGFVVALVLAFLSKDSGNQQLMIGAVVANATTVVSYWLGSSMGSTHKTALAQPAAGPSGT